MIIEEHAMQQCPFCLLNFGRPAERWFIYESIEIAAQICFGVCLECVKNRENFIRGINAAVEKFEERLLTEAN